MANFADHGLSLPSSPPFDLTMRHAARSEPGQTPPVSNQSLIETLTGKLEGAADNISLSRAEVLDIIQRLRPEAKAESTDNRELVEVKQDLKILKAHIRLGDYAGRVFNDLKGKVTDKQLPTRADELVRDLQQEEAFIGSKRKSARTIAFGIAAGRLSLDYPDMDLDTARFAAEAYSARNLACHSECMQKKTADDWPGLGYQINQDLLELEDVLPEGEKEHLEKWQKIITYFRDRHIVWDADAETWQKKPEEDSLVDLAKISVVSSDNLQHLPMRLRERVFASGTYRDEPAASSSQASERRIVQRTDPTQGGSGKRKPSGDLEGEPSAKSRRLDQANSQRWPVITGTKAERAALVLDIANLSDQLAGYNTRESIEELEKCKGSIEKSLKVHIGTALANAGARDADTEMFDVFDRTADADAETVHVDAGAVHVGTSTEDSVPTVRSSGKAAKEAKKAGRRERRSQRESQNH